ncbi:MAG: DNA polymerase III [Burkholderiales bacterium]|nr:DNA polymerase III [Burkholderiales bacterium]
MSASNAEVTAVFNEIADLLEIIGGNAFRVRCYRTAARAVADMSGAIGEALAAGDDVPPLRGLGKDLPGRAAEVVATGTCSLLHELRGMVPPGITSILHLPGMGPRRVQALRSTLGISTLEQLRDAALGERVRMVRGFSPDGERRLLEAVVARLQHERRYTLAEADPAAQALVERLRTLGGVEQVAVAGSLRRRRDTVANVDLVAAAAPGALVMERFVTSPGVERVLAESPARSGIQLAGGLQARLQVVAPPAFGMALLAASSARPHFEKLRALAAQGGLALRGDGLYRGRRRLAGDTEASVYAALGLPFIEPELREDLGELDAAQAGRLPRLVQLGDLRGDLHMHTSAGDGQHSILMMAEAARARGLEYIAITEHSHGVVLGRGFSPGQLSRQIDAIDEINESLDGITVLKSVEVEILPDGRLDLPDSILARLDLVVASAHEQLDMAREQQTARLQRAMDHPCFSILAHPTTRLLEERLAMDVDMPRLVRHARERGCFLELNSHPSRLDLDDRACRMARDEGVLVSIATDSHSTAEFDRLRYGIGQARRGWLEARDVLNSRPLAELRPLLAATMGRTASEVVAA